MKNAAHVVPHNWVRTCATQLHASILSFADSYLICDKFCLNKFNSLTRNKNDFKFMFEVLEKMIIFLLLMLFCFIYCVSLETLKNCDPDGISRPNREVLVKFSIRNNSTSVKTSLVRIMPVHKVNVLKFMQIYWLHWVCEVLF